MNSRCCTFFESSFDVKSKLWLFHKQTALND
jgi:hypothetical protein